MICRQPPGPGGVQSDGAQGATAGSAVATMIETPPDSAAPRSDSARLRRGNELGNELVFRGNCSL